ncbi:hypothetical protein B0H34DRAFT_808599 [Crassisporium funariophilum]|nr:hypothetical protein B0H34DRAFT_808599 [Crassisporium funariophilum]
MVKIASSLVVAALIAAPAFASYEWGLETRDISDHELFGRELSANEATLYARELEELFARIPEDVSAREMQELVERSKIGDKFKHFFQKVWHGIKKVASIVLRRENEEEFIARDYNELDTRDFDELFERYIQEIEERVPHGLSFMKEGMEHIKHLAHKHDLPPPPQQEHFDGRGVDDELYERGFELDLDFFERDFDIDELD